MLSTPNFSVTKRLSARIEIGRVDLAPSADGLARRGADAPADRGERIGPAGHGVGFPVPALRDQRDVLAGLRVDGTRPLAGEVSLEPLAG